MNQQNVLVFIDGPNLNRQQQEMGISIKWEAFREILTGERKLVGIRYYSTPPISTGNLGFHAYLNGIGFEVITCEQGQDVDSLMLEDIHRTYAFADVIVLVGGDGIFVDALTEAAEAGKEVEVVCISTMMAGDFSGIAKMIDPSDFRDAITDPIKTRRRQQHAADSASVTTPGAGFVGQLMALGTRITIETRPREIIIRVTLPPNWAG